MIQVIRITLVSLLSLLQAKKVCIKIKFSPGLVVSVVVRVGGGLVVGLSIKYYIKIGVNFGSGLGGLSIKYYIKIGVNSGLLVKKRDILEADAQLTSFQ